MMLTVGCAASIQEPAEVAEPEIDAEDRESEFVPEHDEPPAPSQETLQARSEAESLYYQLLTMPLTEDLTMEVSGLM